MIQHLSPDGNPPRLKLHVAPTPRRIYDHLRRAVGRRVTVDELVTRILDYPDGGDLYNRAAVHTHICYLRRALPPGERIVYRREPGAEGYELTAN